MNTTIVVPLRCRQRGLSLIELMVSLVLGLFLVAMVGLTYLQAATGARFGALESQMNEDAALVLELLGSQLRLAGYSEQGADGRRLFRGLPLQGCNGGFTSQTEMGDFAKLACENGNGNDAVAVRYQATVDNVQPVNADTAARQGKPSNCANEEIAPITQNGVNLFLADNRFHIQPDTSNGNAPTLYCRGSDGATMNSASALIPNVERLQLRYAITRTPALNEVAPHQVTAFVDAPSDWTRVAAVELCVVMRTARPVPREGMDAADTARFIDCDGAEDNTNTDGRLRRAYRRVVQLPNLRPALPSPYATDNGVALNPYAHLPVGPTESSAPVDKTGISDKGTP